jgi:hypothetical protein
MTLGGAEPLDRDPIREPKHGDSRDFSILSPGIDAYPRTESSPAH